MASSQDSTLQVAGESLSWAGQVTELLKVSQSVVVQELVSI